MDFEIAERISGLPDSELIESLIEAKETLKTARSTVSYVEMLLIQRMEARGASRLRGLLHDVEGGAKTADWDYSKLAQLREFYSAEELEGIYTPAHEKTVNVKEKWDMGKGRRLRKDGDEIVQIIEDARILGRMTLSIKDKKEVSEW